MKNEIPDHEKRDTCPPLEAAEAIADKLLARLDAVVTGGQAAGLIEEVRHG